MEEELAMTYPAIIDTGAYLDYQTNANNYVDSCDVAPIIHHASVEQEKVLPGDLMTVTAEVSDSSPSGIPSVDADSNHEITQDLWCYPAQQNINCFSRSNN